MNLNETEKQMRKVRISSLYHGRSKSNPDAPLTLYANLYDADECGELMISADLDYVLKACKDRGYIIVK